MRMVKSDLGGRFRQGVKKKRIPTTHQTLEFTFTERE
jgi:hypothetical protein